MTNRFVSAYGAAIHGRLTDGCAESDVGLIARACNVPMWQATEALIDSNGDMVNAMLSFAFITDTARPSTMVVTTPNPVHTQAEKYVKNIDTIQGNEIAVAITALTALHAEMQRLMMKIITKTNDDPAVNEHHMCLEKYCNAQAVMIEYYLQVLSEKQTQHEIDSSAKSAAKRK